VTVVAAGRRLGRAVLVAARRRDLGRAVVVAAGRRTIGRALLLTAVLALLAPAMAAAGQPDALAPAYDVDMHGANRGFRWTGTVTLSVANPDPAPLDRLWVRLWGNGIGRCRAPAVRITAVSGATAGAQAVNCTAVPLTLTQPIPPGGRGAVTLAVDIRVPHVVDRFGIGGRGVALLSNALPALAHREGGRWRLDRYFPIGEAWTYPAADWHVRLSAPPGVAIAAPGVLQADGSRVVSHGRDYSWAAGRLRALRASVSGVAVTVWNPRARPRAEALAALRIVANRLPRLERLFGLFGWPDLQVVVTGAAAMEHTAFVMSPANDLVLTHELAHEWWFGSVGDDQAKAPWLDEGFATWAENAARGLPTTCPRDPRVARQTTRGVDFFRTRPFDYISVYDGGGCLLAKLERRMGRARFRSALRAYAVSHRYGWSTAAEFRAAMDAAAGGKRLGDLWRAFRVH
jgi:hypothetical protein